MLVVFYFEFVQTNHVGIFLLLLEFWQPFLGGIHQHDTMHPVVLEQWGILWHDFFDIRPSHRPVANGVVLLVFVPQSPGLFWADAKLQFDHTCPHLLLPRALDFELHEIWLS